MPAAYKNIPHIISGVYITFGSDNEAPLELLERLDGHLPISVVIEPSYEPSETVEKALKEKIIPRMTTLRTERHFNFIDELLRSQPFPKLTYLNVVALPPVRGDLSGTLWPYLTHINLEVPSDPTMPNTGDALLEFIQNCPELRIVRVICADFNPKSKYEKIPLPQLDLFNHQSPVFDIGLYNRLSLPHDCHVGFTVTDLVSEAGNPWMDNFFALLSDIKTKVEIKFHTRNDELSMVRMKFSNSGRGSISLDKSTPNKTFSARQVEGVLDFLTRCEMTRPVEVLSFGGCPVSRGEGDPDPDLTGQLSKLGNLKELKLRECEPSFFLQNPSPPAAWCPPVKNLDIFLPLSTSPQDLLERVAVIAASRKMLGEPLNTVSLTFQDRVRTSEEVIEKLNGCVGSVEIGCTSV